MKNKKIEVLWLFQKPKTDAPIKIRIGVTRRGYPLKPGHLKIFIMIMWGAAIVYSLIYLFQLVFLQK